MSSPSPPPIYDVIIIGGGFSGMAAANYLYDHSTTNFLVLESRERLGGRTFTEEVPSLNGTSGTNSVDLGGAYVGPTQNRILRLISELNLKTKRVYSNAKFVVQMNKSEDFYPGANAIVPQHADVSPLHIEHYGTVPFNLNPFVLLDINYLLSETHMLSLLVDTTQPWNSPLNKSLSSPDGIPLDEMTVAHWTDKRAQTPTGALLYKSTVSGILCVEPHEISMLFWLFYVASGKGLLRLIETDKGAQERKVVGGTQQICELLANKVGRNKVKLGSAVRDISYETENNASEEKKSKSSSSSPSLVTITTKSGQIYRTHSLIVALSPSLYSTLSFSPPLPPAKSLASRRMYMGSIIKTITRFSTPYWRIKGYNGTVLNNQGPVAYSYDDCHQHHVMENNKIYEGERDEKWESDKENQRKYMKEPTFYAIMGFVLGDAGRAWMALSKEERASAIAKQYAHAFHCEDMDKDIITPIGYYELNWDAEEYSKGCYVGVMPPGVLSNVREELRNPVGNKIFFAGTELATVHSGYMDGAIQAGERAAHRVLEDIQGREREGKKDKNADSKIIGTLGEWREESEVNLKGDMIPEPMDPKWYELMLPRPNSVKKGLYAVTGAVIAVGFWYVNVYLKQK